MAEPMWQPPRPPRWLLARTLRGLWLPALQAVTNFMLLISALGQGSGGLRWVLGLFVGYLAFGVVASAVALSRHPEWERPASLALHGPQMARRLTIVILVAAGVVVAGAVLMIIGPTTRSFGLALALVGAIAVVTGVADLRRSVG